MEIWLDIKEFEGCYQISSEGRVRSLDRFVNCNTGKKFIKGIILKPVKDPNGYAHVSLQNGKIKKTAKIHILVSKHFLKEIENKPEINHIDGNKLNNKLSNLEYCSRKENEEHCYALGLKKTGENRVNAKLTFETAKFIKESYGTLTAKQLADMFKVSESTVWHCAKGRTWNY